MAAIIEFLSGKKTIIGTVLLGVLGILLSLGIIDVELFGVLASLVAIFTGVAVREAIAKSGS